MDKKIFTDSDIVKLEPWFDPELVRVVDYNNLTEDDAEWIKTKTNKKYQNKDSITVEAYLRKVLERVHSCSE